MYLARLSASLNGLTPVETRSGETVFIGARDGYVLAVRPAVGRGSARPFLVGLAGLRGIQRQETYSGEDLGVTVLARFGTSSWDAVEKALERRTVEFAAQATLRLRDKSSKQTGLLELSWDYAEHHQVSTLVDAVVEALKTSASPVPEVCDSCGRGGPVSVTLRKGVPRYICGAC